MALDIQPGDEIISTPFTFFATASTIVRVGAVPVLVDINLDDYNIDATKIEAAITPKTKAIMPVSLYGQCADMDAINAIAAKHNLAVIEDAAQSFGATYKGKYSCNLSTIACTSFYPSKPLGCYGDGGACFTNDPAIATKLRQLRNHGQDRTYHHIDFGLNARLDSIQAAVLLVKLDFFAEEIRLRNIVADRYAQVLPQEIIKPTVLPENVSVFAQYTIRCQHRDALQQYLNTAGIPTAIHYPIPLNKQPIFTQHFPDQKEFPLSELAAAEVLSLPMHPYLELEQQTRIAAAISDFMKKVEKKEILT